MLFALKNHTTDTWQLRKMKTSKGRYTSGSPTQAEQTKFEEEIKHAPYTLLPINPDSRLEVRNRKEFLVISEFGARVWIQPSTNHIDIEETYKDGYRSVAWTPFPISQPLHLMHVNDIPL